jgi:phage/plasmid primase-like uncharacterized protein
MGEVLRDRLPDWLTFADRFGVELDGRGKWRTTGCVFHGGSDSLRVNTETGGWICMACGVKGGDVLAYVMKAHNVSLARAAWMLGAWSDDDEPPQRSGRCAPRLSEADRREIAALDLVLCVTVLSDARRGLLPSEKTWQAFLAAAGRVGALFGEARP